VHEFTFNFVTVLLKKGRDFYSQSIELLKYSHFFHTGVINIKELYVIPNKRKIYTF